MIAARHAFLLRNPEACFEGVHVGGLYGCKVCSASERGTVRVHPAEFDTHLAKHRRESLVREARRTDFLEECE